jgi:hypothetical protein
VDHNINAQIRRAMGMSHSIEPTYHPPRPQLTVRVGVAGHRPDKLIATRSASIERQLKKVFTAIDAAANELLAAGDGCYSNDPPVIRLVSGFAEGSDRLALSACPANWQIEAILPFPQAQYIDTLTEDGDDAEHTKKSFQTALKKAETVTELSLPEEDGDAAYDRNETRHLIKSYTEAGSFFLRQIDVLVVIWDGKPPKVAGTGAIARQAMGGGIPVVWIATHGNHSKVRKTQHSSNIKLAIEEDHVPRLIVRFDENGDPDAPETDCTNGSLAAAIQRLFALPESPHTQLRDFCNESWRSLTLWFAYDVLKRIANLQKPRLIVRTDPFDKCCVTWDRFLTLTPQVPNLTARVREILLPRYVWADSLAVYFSHQYRSAYVFAYLLAAGAVFIALGSLFWPELNFKFFFVVAELGLIISIIGIIWVGRFWRWHERWLEYRALAEGLRYSRFLAFIGEFGQVQNRQSGSNSLWALWYLRATMREIGLPTAVIDSAYLWRLLNATLTDEIKGQFDYHESNSKSTHNIDRMLHDLAIGCFALTAIVFLFFVIAYIYAYWTGTTERDASWIVDGLHWLKSHMIFFSAGLPALGAALAGIRVHGDFEGSEARSDAMLNTLKSLELDYAAAMNQTIGLDDAARLVLQTAREMSEDVHAWRELHGRKRLELPA